MSPIPEVQSRAKNDWNGTIWLCLILSGIGFVIVALVAYPFQLAPALVMALLVITEWICWGAYSSHRDGIRRHILKHLGPGDWREGQVVTHVVPTNERASFQLALDHLRQAGDPAAPVFGIHVSPMGGTQGIVELIGSNAAPVPVEWESFPRSVDEQLDCATNALSLLRHKGAAFCALVRPRHERSRKQMELEVMALARETAQAGLAAILEASRTHSVYRGGIVSLERPEDRKEEFSIKFHLMPTVDRSSIILPEEILRAVDRNVLGLLTHGEALRRAGRSTRHGVLFHGPPGVGKTLVTKYLARACTGYTVILLTGRNLRFIRESCRLARFLAPSMVVMEDVDLVATDRQKNRHNTLLHDLLDEMDGLGPHADCVFLLTTNRPEVLERALSHRPGRVDQAIFFPLPDLECRRRLFTCLSKGLDFGELNLESILHRTEGASPAFIEELIRKAALMAAERGEKSSPMRLRNEDFDRALRELLEFGGELTRNLLGFERRPKPAN